MLKLRDVIAAIMVCCHTSVGGGNLLFMPTLISTLSYRPKTQSFTHRKYFITVDLQTIFVFNSWIYS